MYRGLIYLVPFVLGLGLGLPRSANGGLIGHWTFDENSGTIAADSSGQGNGGTIEGNAHWVAGKMGNSALNFDDSDDIVIIEDAPSLDVEDALTISLWVNTPEVVNPNHMVTKQPSGTAPDNYPGNYEFRVKQDTIQFLHQTSESTDYSEYHSTSQITANEWHHAVVSVTEGDVVEFYLDGIPAGSLPQLGVFGVLNDNSLRIGGRKDNHFFNGILDDVYIYNRALSLNQIEGLGEGIEPTFYKAEDPSIEDGALYENTWVSLSWTPGEAAVSHDVYFGDDFNDVNDATQESETFRGNQTSTFFVVGFPGYPYPDGLAPGTTYYWRIDEVNDTDPDSPCKGYIWSFSIPPRTAYDPDPPDGAEIEDPNNVTLIWTPGFGAILHTVYFGDNFDEVNDATGGTLQGPATYDPGVLELAKIYYWRVDEFDAVETYKGEVWTFTTPGAVGHPQPVNGATDVAMATILSWTPADNAASHDLYIGTDKEVVRNADTNSSEYKGSVALGSESYDPGFLHWNTTYFWRVDEVNSQGNPTKGPIWSFTTGNFLIIEDFESYTDDETAGEAIWQTWIDGFGVADNGAQVGYLIPPYAEQTIVHSGSQSMPLIYDNTANAANSEATLTLTDLRDWTAQRVSRLTLWFRGTTDNAGDPLYVSIANSSGNSAVVAHENRDAASTITTWTQWVIPLQNFADQGIDLTEVDRLTIGLGTKAGMAASNGSGTMYFDDIRLQIQ
jgi:hypothetical protein